MSGSYTLTKAISTNSVALFSDVGSQLKALHSPRRRDFLPDDDDDIEMVATYGVAPENANEPVDQLVRWPFSTSTTIALSIAQPPF